MSKASNLAGFVTSISPVNNLTVGVITATSFVGNITGTATSATTATTAITAGTATTATVAEGLTGTPNIIVGVATVTGIDGIAYSGVTTTSTNKLLVNREYCTVVSPGVTLTLPASPSPGWEVGVAVGGTFTDTVIARNGSNIMGLAENLTLDKEYISLQMIYTSSTVGWRFY